jgi:hypothetical protein
MCLMNYQILLILNIAFLAEKQGMKTEQYGVFFGVQEKIRGREPAAFPEFI